MESDSSQTFTTSESSRSFELAMYWQQGRRELQFYQTSQVCHVRPVSMQYAADDTTATVGARSPFRRAHGEGNWPMEHFPELHYNGK